MVNLVPFPINNFYFSKTTAVPVIPSKLVPAKAGSGNPGKPIAWIPDQVRNDMAKMLT